MRHGARVNPPLFRKTFAFDDVLGLPLADATTACESAGFRLVVDEWPVLNPSEYFALLADTFSADELAAAQAALIEDARI